MFLAGLGIFLFGMYHLEKGINGLAGKSFKTILRDFTNTPLKGILTGTLASSVLQSSSLVTLLASAFLGGGILKLRNAISIVFGANIGTTSTAWIVAFLGFKLDISAFSFPFLAIGSLTYLFMDNRPMFKNIGSFMIGFGLIFLGIDFLKSAVETYTQNVNFSYYASFGLWMYILLGIVITALIQSSSAMMVIVLSALHGNMIDIEQACVLAIGGNIGTTVTLVLASLGGTADKKRLALSHIVFNVIGGLIAFILLVPVLRLLTESFHISDPIFQVSAFNTVMNLLGVMLFFPFLNRFSLELSKLFKEKVTEGDSKFINKVSTEVTDVALTALDNEIKNVFNLTKSFVYKVLHISDPNHGPENTRSVWFQKEDNPLTTYNIMKKTEDEVTTFYKKLQSRTLSDAESNLLAAHMIRLRSLVYAAKNMKDIISNVKELEDSDEEIPAKILLKLKEFSVEKITIYTKHISSENKHNVKEKWHRDLDLFYHQTIDFLYDQLTVNTNGVISVSTMTNVIKKTVSCLEEMSNAALHENNIRDSITEIYG